MQVSFDPVARRISPSGYPSDSSISLDCAGGSVCFVSHAHADHAVKNAENIISSSETLALLKARGYAKKTAQNFAQINGIKFKLLDAGHVLGSRQLLVENSSTFLYTGDVRLTPSLTAGSAEIAQCDELFIETTYGSEEYVFPSRLEVGEQIAKWVKANQSRGEITILGGYALGKAQEVIAALNEFAGVAPVVSGDVEKISQVYKQLGVKLDFVSASSEEGKSELRKPFVSIISLNKVTPALSYALKEGYGRGVKLAACSGWTSTSSSPGLTGFPLSDHADYRELLEIVEQSNAQKIYCAYGFAREFAARLRKSGKNAVALSENKRRAGREHCQQTLTIYS